MKTLYQIKPLVWQGKTPTTEDGEFWDGGYSAEVPMGSYFINRREGGQWQWGYCFDEYYDEGCNDCDGLEDGMAKAQEDWNARILPALEEVKP